MMSLREMNAVIQIISQAIIALWVISGVAATDATVMAVANKALWAILYMILLNIAGTIVGSIILGISNRGRKVDEPADERDWSVHQKAMRNAYFALSIGVLAYFFLLAFGIDPVTSAYGLFGVTMLAGTVFSASQLVYYRFG
jgi:hypothetical protein